MSDRRCPAPRRRLALQALAACAGCALLSAHAAEPGHEWRPWPRNKAVPPPMELDALDGTRWRAAASRGQVLLVNFWATWCEPCRAELPSLQRLALRGPAQGLRVVAANYGESPAAVQRFLQAQGLQLDVVLDRDGQLARAWTPRIFPSTVVFDRRGRPAGVLVGEIDWDTAEARALLAPVLATRP
ncbi:MAG: TlpA family protein disulfide reductase [Rubrivivax sp.]|nr:TlpA family protein disulfide reductase [Rubrivivax sp.]